MKNKKLLKGILPAALSAAMVVSGISPVLAGEPAKGEGNVAISDATKSTLQVKVDEKDLGVTEYIDAYVTNPTDVCGSGTNYNGIDQAIDIYVPDNATKDSAILLYVNNSGWRSDAWSERRVQLTEGDTFVSDSDTDIIGAALKRGMILVSYGARSRADKVDANGKYISHAPATMTDTKAVIRYLRANAATLGKGDVDKIVVTGTSGGGALSTIIAASGNSSDYYESLYEVGAAGISKDSDGNYVSSIKDDVFGTIAYCPINDLREADAAYEWTYLSTREKMIADGTADFIGGYTQESAMKASVALADQYNEYVDSLGLKLDDGSALTSENLQEAIEGLLKDEIEESMDEKEIGIAQMKTDAANGKTYNSTSTDWKDWLTIKEDKTYDFDYDQYLYYVARNTTLKVPCAFSNKGLNVEKVMNEDNLYGTTSQEYSPYEFYSWNNDATLDNGVGYDDTGLTWNEYLKTKDGKVLSSQLRMTSPIAYLTDAQGDDAGDSAKYWYVRHGMVDRDTSFALQTILRYALTNDTSIKDVDFEFTWNRPHSGNYDVQEAMAWLDSAIADYETPTSIEGAKVTLSKTSYTYSGKEKKPSVTVTLKDGSILDPANYTVAYKNNKKAGSAKVIITAKGKYTGTLTKAFTIAKAKQTISKKAKSSYTYKKSSLKKVKKIAIKATAKGKITYSVTYPKGKKGNVTVKNGKIIIKKHAKTGTYKVVIKAAKTANYNSAKKTITIKIKK